MMSGPQMFGFPATPRKWKGTVSHFIPQMPNEGSVRMLVSDRAAQHQNVGHTSPSGQERQAEDNPLDMSRDLSFGVSSGLDMATASETLVAVGAKKLGHHQFIIQPKPSSQLLGNSDYNPSHNPESRVDQTGGSLRDHGSSSTPRSFYDPRKIPLAVSQQTSNSSARDLALRKGCAPVVTVEKHVSRPIRLQKNPDATIKSTKTTSTRFDLSTLFPQPSAHHDHLHSSRIGRGHIDVSDELLMPPAFPFGPSTSQKYQVDNATKAPHRLRRCEHLAPRVDDPYGLKTNIREPEGGTKYWFDAFKDEDLENSTQGMIVESRLQARLGNGSRPPINTLPVELEAHFQKSDDISPRSQRYDPPSGGNASYLQVPAARGPRTTGPGQEQLQRTLRNWEFRSKHHQSLTAKNSTTQIRRSRSNPLNRVDLHIDSVLWLSSSDDDSEADESLQSDIGTTIPGIRDSLIVAPLGSSHVETGTASAITTKRPEIEKGFACKHGQRQHSRMFGCPPKSVQVPERQSSKMFSFLNDQSKSLPNTQNSSSTTSHTAETFSETVGNYLHSPSTAAEKRDTFIGLMTVTPQEKSLLEAIRSKRASMRQNIFAETFQRTSEGEQGGRPSSQSQLQISCSEGNSASFFHLSQDSMPTLSAFPNHRRSISASEVIGFNGVEPRASSSTETRTSYRGSLAHSSLPSTSSQETPLTPTLETESDNSNRRTGSSKKRYSTLPTNHQRHSRVRPRSSAVIVLDNLDDDSSSHFKLDDLPIWAFNGWPDTPGLAGVQ